MDELRRYWSDFKAGREGARFLAAFCAFIMWLLYVSVT